MNYYIIDLSENFKYCKVSKICFLESLKYNIEVAHECGDSIEEDINELVIKINHNDSIDVQANAFQFFSTYKEWFDIEDYWEL